MAIQSTSKLTKYLLTGVATTALTLGLVASASAQNSSLSPTFGTETFAQGFISSRLTIQAGGDIDAFTFADTCNGFIADAPDLIIDYSGQSGLQIEAGSNEDTTIVVEMPDGAIICNDDFDGLNPGVQMATNEPGRYAVWVGTFEPIQNNTYPDADIFISEIDGLPTPPAAPTPTPTPTPSAGLDPFAAPAFGSISVAQGFGTQTFDMQAGGDVDAFNFDNRCAGFVASVPDYVIDYQGQSNIPLNISATSGEDTTLVVIDPNGNVFCNDDANGTLDPALSISNPGAGNYAVWVGTFSSSGGTFPETVLTVSSSASAPTPPVQGFNPNQAPTFGLVEVTPGFGTQTFDLQAGGEMDAFSINGSCAGFVADAPDYVLEFQGNGRMPLNLSVNSADDTTLVVVGPNGGVFCNDDDTDLNPALYLGNAASGDYAVWVGTFNPIQNGFYPEAQLTVATDSSSPTPRPTPSVGIFDVISTPTFGSVNLGSNLGAGHAITLQAGGFTDAFEVNPACNGWVAEVPDYVINYEGGRTPMTIAVESEADTTLVVITPDGQVLCNDDDIDLNPGVTINNPGGGDYTIYVGTYLPIENDFYPDALLTVSGQQSTRPSVPSTPGTNFNQRALQTPTFGSVNLANGFANHSVDIQAGGALEGFEFGDSCNGYVADAPDYTINYGGGSDLQITATSGDDTTMTVITPSGEVLCNDDFGDLNPGMFINDAGAGSYAVWIGTYLPIENDRYPDATINVSEVSDNKVQPSGAITSTSLTAGFTPDPFTTVLAAGGPIDAGTVDGMCNGFIATEPDFALNYTSGDWPLRVYVQSDADTTLLMRTPSGEILCNDDFDGLNPSLALSSPDSGIYEVFIGTYDPAGGNPNATLAVTELLDQKDLPPGAVIETSVVRGMQREDFDLIAGGSFQAFEVLNQACGGYVANAPDFLAYVEDAGVDVEMTVRSAEDTTLAVRTPSGQFICDDDSGGDFNPLVTLEGAQVGAYEVWLGTFSSVGNAPATLSVRDMNADSGTAPNVPGGGKK